MKKLKWIAVGLVGVVIVLFAGAILALNVPSVHRAIETKVSAASGFDVELGTFRPAFPLRLGVGFSHLKSPALDVTWTRAAVGLSLIPPFGVSLELDEPHVTLAEAPADQPKPETKSTAPGSGEGGGAPALPGLRLSLRVRGGEIDAAGAKVRDLDLDFAQSRLMQTPASLTLDARVAAGPLPAPLPLHLETDSLTFTPAQVAAREIAARVAGIDATLGGASDLTAESHAWTLKVHAPDLAKVPAPKGDVEAWTGAVEAEVKVAKTKAALDADGFVRATAVEVALRSKRAGAEVAGPLKADVDAQFGYHGGRLSLPRAKGRADLSSAGVTYGAMLKKPKGTALTLDFDVSGQGERLDISQVRATFADVRARASGRASTATPFDGHVDLDVAPFTLDDLAPLVPALAKVPARGTVIFKGALDGPLGDVKKLRVQITKAALEGPLGQLTATGVASETTSPKGPRLDLVVGAQPLLLAGVRAALPDLKDLVPAGEVRARVKLKGQPALGKPWPEWPLDVGGEVSVKIPEYVIKTAAKPAAKPGPGGSASAPAHAKPTGFLPKGYLTEHLEMKLDGEVQRVRFGDLEIAGARGRGALGGGHFRGEGGVAQVFGGRASTKNLDVPLLEPSPVITGEADWAAIVIERAVGFAKPEFKDFATGITAGRARFKTRMPGEADFMTQLTADGQASAEPVTLNSVKLGEIINQSLGKLPGVKLPPVKLTPLKGAVNLSFAVAKGTAELPSVVARDVDNSELALKGRVRLADLNGDFTGTFAWANSPLRGCMAEGNQDGRGRVVVPVAVKGDLMHPGVSVVGDTLTKMGAKALECEGKKMIERAKKDGIGGLKDEAGKVLKGLFGH